MLHVVATPIGNLADLSRRAVDVLASADLIVAEDTRRCRKLLSHLGLSRRIVAYHDHSDDARENELLAALLAGNSLALVADAGTPLISDPGFRLVRAARAAGVQVSCVPGPCAAIAALSVAGLPSDRFVFEGFLPARDAARRARLQELQRESRTLIFYESPRRIGATLAAMETAFGTSRAAVLVRELTKLHETVLGGSLAVLRARVDADPEQQLGEIVLLVHGAPPETDDGREQDERALRALLPRMPLSEAVECTKEITGSPHNLLYRLALELRSEE